MMSIMSGPGDSSSNASANRKVRNVEAEGMGHDRDEMKVLHYARPNAGQGSLQ
jgi:hypothetical protein